MFCIHCDVLIRSTFPCAWTDINVNDTRTKEAQCLNVKASCAVDTTPIKWRLESIQLPPNHRADLTLLPAHQPSLYEKRSV